jgi:hypothetical protein
MIKANKTELESINNRYNDVQDDLNVGIDYCGEGLEITEFEVDDKGRTTVNFTEWYLNRQYALRTREFVRHPRLKKEYINYLLGRTDEC